MVEAFVSHTARRFFALGAAIFFCAIWTVASQAALIVSPDTIVLDRPEACQQLLVTEICPDQNRDRTRDVDYRIADPAIARVDRGIVYPLAEGMTQLLIRRGDEQISIPVTVNGLAHPTPVSFRYEVQPIMTKARCNS